MNDEIYVVGASMTKFGRFPDVDLVDLATTAARDALQDARLTMSDVGLIAMGNVYDAISHNAQRVQKQIGQTGIPAYNVVNACATGATAVRTAVLAIKAGECSAALVIGAEKMGKMGLLGGAAKKAASGHVYERKGRFGAVASTEGVIGTGLMPGVFAQAGMEYARANDVPLERFAQIAEKNHANSVLNPFAQYQQAFTLEEISNAEMIAFPNTLPMCCPTGDGASALMLASGERLATLDHEQRRRAVKLSASVLTTDPWTESDQILPDINTLTRAAADAAYEEAGVGPEDLDLVELHDCFATAELLHYDNLRLCEPGGAAEFIERGGPARDGETPVNVSGGLLSKGHPLGATGVANIYEIVTHLRGEAGDRQIEGARVGLAHVIGLASACGVHVLERTAA